MSLTYFFANDCFESLNTELHSSMPIQQPESDIIYKEVPHTQVDQEHQITTAVERWSSNEDNLGVPKEHQRRFFWGSVPGKATPLVATMIHGLYNSPEALESIADIFVEKLMNTMMTRLSGHREANKNVLKKEIQWQKWQEEAEEEFLLAKKLGKKVILVGHSTGALLSTWLAVKYPEDIAALILFSPAFGVHTLAKAGAHFGKITGINPVKPDGKLLSGHAGVEVDKAARAFKKWPMIQGQGDRDYLGSVR